MKFRGLLLIVASGLLVAGCDSSSDADQYSAPGAAPAVPVPAAPAPPAAPPPAAVPNVPPAVGRPMTVWEKQYKTQCESNLVANGCQFYTDNSLKVQGINPDS
ncbi:MAG TPA: hypothetical protein VGM60_20450 [Pseudonocardia sp.]|jgi:hypothetical protein|uniref:hypothetical protein n=1 Tax=Pseudonocardia sp. TaxID=60912 RepID=UPI002F40CBC9